MNLDDELIRDVAGNTPLILDRAKLKTRLLEVFGRTAKKPVFPAILQHRLDQMERLVDRLKIGFNEDLAVEVEPDPQDWLVFQHLRYGCEWHESVDIIPLVRECLPG